MKHPTKCTCGGPILAVFNIVRCREVKLDGTLGDWTDGGCYSHDYYECEKCSVVVDRFLESGCIHGDEH